MLLAVKLPLFLSRLNEISGCCGKILSVSLSFGTELRGCICWRKVIVNGIGRFRVVLCLFSKRVLVKKNLSY